MYARDLMIWLHERLAQRDTFEQTMKRFESLRGYALLPRGRENAGVRLSNEQIASATLAFAHPLPGYAGLASLILGDLRPIGDAKTSLANEAYLKGVITALIENADKSFDLLRLTLSVEQDFGDDEYTAVLYFRDSGQTRMISFVSKYAVSLLQPGAEKGYDHERLDKLTAIQRSFGPSFFQDLSRAVSISRHLDRPYKTDWREYETEEKKAEFHKRLGARRSSNFLNLRVDAQVTWPKEPTRMKFDGRHLVLFPKTKDLSHSISIDLHHERISARDARSLMNRLLSVMSWCDDQPASLHAGWSGGHIPVPVPRENLGFGTAHEWYFYRSLPDDEKLLRCLAFYRDGLNAHSVGLASHAVLSFFRVFETKYNSKKKVVEWVNLAFSDVKEGPTKERFQAFEKESESKNLDVGSYVYSCRVATAHAARDAPSNPDSAYETLRLLNAARVIQRLARHFIEQEFKFSDSYLTDDYN